jgi:hypothetical protein
MAFVVAAFTSPHDVAIVAYVVLPQLMGRQNQRKQ